MRAFLVGVLVGVLLSVALRPRELKPVSPEPGYAVPPYDPRLWQELYRRV